jgi:hypothetical protein
LPTNLLSLHGSENRKNSRKNCRTAQPCRFDTNHATTGSFKISFPTKTSGIYSIPTSTTSSSPLTNI